MVEVAIVRPGPIQGDMVHPYLRRRDGIDAHVAAPSRAELEEVLKRTLGVPLFQEQAMQIAIVAAKFTPGEADQLRRAMATFRNDGRIYEFRQRFIDGMVNNGYELAFAERCFSQIEGFGTYGFPESHAASFAILVNASAWVKCHHPDVFLCAILNSQPMGFYQPAQLVRDAREHGVDVRPVDVNASRWDSILEDDPGHPKGYLAVRLGFRLIKGVSDEAAAAKIVAAREHPLMTSPPGSVAALRYSRAPECLRIWRKAMLSAALGARARREAIWGMKALRDDPLPLFTAADRSARRRAPNAVNSRSRLRPLTPGGEVAEDYAHLAFSLRRHPLSFLREKLPPPRLAVAGCPRKQSRRTALS